MRVPLVHGRATSARVDGDPPAAYRYTEAKLAKAAETLLAELDQETVDLRPNYDGTRREPVVLPAQFPNLLVNGTSRHRRRHGHEHPAAQPGRGAAGLRASSSTTPTRPSPQLLDKVKGPDFPLGGKIVTDRATLRKHLRNGPRQHQGPGRVEARRPRPSGKQQIVVTSIPYGVDKGELENAIGGHHRGQEAPATALGSSNETNEKEGLRIVLEMKAGHRPEPGDGVPVQAHRVAEELLATT